MSALVEPRPAAKRRPKGQGVLARWLMIEKDGKGVPILPIFKVAAGEVTRGGGEAPVFAKVGPVWKAERAKESASASAKALADSE